jgi:hypothetical protein
MPKKGKGTKNGKGQGKGKKDKAHSEPFVPPWRTKPIW